jgi:hypothetical protein
MKYNAKPRGGWQIHDRVGAEDEPSRGQAGDPALRERPETSVDHGRPELA